MKRWERNLRVLYEDNHLLVVNKRPSDIVQGDRTGDMPLSEEAKKFLREKYDKPGEAYLGVVHRLDRPVGGVVLFAKTSKALARLNESFKKREVKKTYWACLQNQPEPTAGTLENHLVRNQKKNKSFTTKASTAHAKVAVLDYRLIATSDRYFMVEVTPRTGRHHQIRVQLSAAGWPIKGDIKYGAQRTNRDASIHLYARKLEIMHPVKKIPMTWVAPVPDDPVWKSMEKSINDTGDFA